MEASFDYGLHDDTNSCLVVSEVLPSCNTYCYQNCCVVTDENTSIWFLDNSCY